MKRLAFNLLAVLAIFALLFSGGGQVLADQEVMANTVAPSMISYQGSVTVSGSPYNGTGYFKFAIVNAAGNTSYWSNDGSSVSGSQPTAYLALTVTNGLFSVLLGQGYSMEATVFSSPDRLLRVWFSTTPGGAYTLLTPDRQIASVPFAMQAENAVNADKLDGQQGNYYQARVSSSCAVGSTIKSIDASGSVICTPVEPRMGYGIQTINADGYYASMAIGVDGLPVIAFKDDINLRVAHCENPACTVFTITNVDGGTAQVGFFNSLAIGADGYPVISYIDLTNYYLKVAKCLDVACMSSTQNFVHYLGTGNQSNTSLAIGVDGYPIISFFDATNYDLKVVHCTNADCSGYPTPTVYSGGYYGSYSSITIAPDGKAVISFNDGTSGSLIYLHCNNIECNIARRMAVDTGNLGAFTSLTIGIDGMPIISYYDVDDFLLKVAHCGDIECLNPANIDIHTLDQQDEAGGSYHYTSITIGADGMPLILYYEALADDLVLYHCNDILCSTAPSVYTLDSSGDTGSYPTVKIGSDGLPVISYMTYSPEYLKVMHCSNNFCTPYVRR
jgi:hypothetical protein